MKNKTTSNRGPESRSKSGRSERRKPRLSPYVEPKELRGLRVLFLETIAREAETVLEDLKKTVFSLRPSRRTAGHCGFPSPLEDWAERHHLWDEGTGAGRWILDAAEATLEHWDDHPDLPPPLRWCEDPPVVLLSSLKSDDPGEQAFVTKSMSDLDEGLSFTSPRWDPSREMWKEYLERACIAYRAFLENVGRSYEELFKHCYEKKVCVNEAERHILWLVRSQIFGESHETIRRYSYDKKHEVTKRSIGVAIASIAHVLIGQHSEIWQRKSKGGRPPRKSRK